MRAHSVEPTLSWPTDGRYVANRVGRVDDQRNWSSRTVARAEEPLARVAALLLSISQNNSYEGRDPEAIPEVLTSGFVADLLGLDIGELAALLVDLRRRGLIEPGPNASLQLKDRAALERLVG